jgi:hypothetical protein
MNSKNDLELHDPENESITMLPNIGIYWPDKYFVCISLFTHASYFG